MCFNLTSRLLVERSIQLSAISDWSHEAMNDGLLLFCCWRCNLDAESVFPENRSQFGIGGAEICAILKH